MTRCAGRLMPHQRCTLLRPSEVADGRILASDRGNDLKYKANFACLYPSKRCGGQILLHIFGGLGQKPLYALRLALVAGVMYVLILATQAIFS